MNAMIPGAVIEEELEFLHQRLHQEALDEPTEPAGEDYLQWLREKYDVFKVKLTQYSDLYELACELNRRFRSEVFRGQRSPDTQKDAAQRRLFATLLRVGEALQERVEYFTRHALPLDGERRTALDHCVEDLRRELADWKPPALSLSPALRVQRFSPEAAAKLQEILSPHEK